VQAVEEVVHVKCREAKNDEGKKPEEMFNETHKELMKDGEKWAKETAGTFAIVGVLVITVTFAALFTVPGGLHEDTGMPTLIKEKRFTVFIVADVISFLASIITVLIYIDLQTSRYAATDFLERLPTKIMSGLGFLSLSLVSMMIAFCAALGIVLQKSSLYKHLFVGVIILAGIPFILLIPSLLRLLLQIFPFITKNPITIHHKSTFIGKFFRNLLLLPVKACRH
ncbi:ankyrin repeat-containing protein ITN1-like, partial [Vigna umbellata]|uniref:ankyrin repeat-containing protein ITN1-like n=1 Tax=Vigna umbellata TaxID=87088 RepID=UPI001F5EEA6B